MTRARHEPGTSAQRQFACQHIVQGRVSLCKAPLTHPHAIDPWLGTVRRGEQDVATQATATRKWATVESKSRSWRWLAFPLSATPLGCPRFWREVGGVLAPLLKQFDCPLGASRIFLERGSAELLGPLVVEPLDDLGDADAAQVLPLVIGEHAEDIPGGHRQGGCGVQRAPGLLFAIKSVADREQRPW